MCVCSFMCIRVHVSAQETNQNTHFIPTLVIIGVSLSIRKTKRKTTAVAVWFRDDLRIHRYLPAPGKHSCKCNICCPYSEFAPNAKTDPRDLCWQGSFLFLWNPNKKLARMKLLSGTSWMGFGPLSSWDSPFLISHLWLSLDVREDLAVGSCWGVKGSHSGALGNTVWARPPPHPLCLTCIRLKHRTDGVCQWFPHLEKDIQNTCHMHFESLLHNGKIMDRVFVSRRGDSRVWSIISAVHL